MFPARLPAALVAVLAAYVLRRRRQRSVDASAAAAGSAAADASGASKFGLGKDLEAGTGGSSSPAGGSAWGSLGSASQKPPSKSGSLRDSAMGSRATASSNAGGEGSGHGSGTLGLSDGVAGDTDVRRLPGGWATIDFAELELSSVLGESRVCGGKGWAEEAL